MLESSPDLDEDDCNAELPGNEVIALGLFVE